MRPFEAEQSSSPSRSIELNSIFAIVVAVGMLGLGLVMRNNSLGASILFRDQINGIRAQIPAQWLLDTSGGTNYVFRAEDPNGKPFKTLIQVSIRTVGPDASPQNVVDSLNVIGPSRLSNYGVLSTEPSRLGEDEAIEITYYYVQTEPNPFVQAVPIVVQGVDLVVTRGNQAIIFTYRDASEVFEKHRFYFENFLATVEY